MASANTRRSTVHEISFLVSPAIQRRDADHGCDVTDSQAMQIFDKSELSMDVRPWPTRRLIDNARLNGIARKRFYRDERTVAPPIWVTPGNEEY
jgi:hypothetical protein